MNDVLLQLAEKYSLEIESPFNPSYALENTKGGAFWRILENNPVNQGRFLAGKAILSTVLLA